MGKCALIRNENKLTFSLKKWASEYKQEHSRDAPFIPPPEQSIFEREAPQDRDNYSSQALAQEQDMMGDERTHPDLDVVDTWHLGSDVPAVFERPQRHGSDTNSKS